MLVQLTYIPGLYLNSKEAENKSRCSRRLFFLLGVEALKFDTP